MKKNSDIPVGTLALILSKHYYGVMSKMLEGLEVERYFSVLYFLDTHDGCTQQFICNNLAIDKTAMVKVMDYLIQHKYIQRKVNAKDRREHIISLTKKGSLRTVEIVNCFEELDKLMFKGISKENVAIFLEVMDKTNTRLKKMPANDLFFSYRQTAGIKSEPKTK